MNKKTFKHKAVKIDIERETSLKLIEEFFEREYDHLPDFSDLHHINIGVDELEFPEKTFNEISIDVDLIDFAIRFYFDGCIVNERRYSELSILNDKELLDPCLDELFSEISTIVRAKYVENLDLGIIIHDDNGMPKNKKLAIGIIDVFENFLYNKGIDIPNEDKTGDEEEAIIYGSDYRYLEDAIEHILDMEG